MHKFYRPIVSALLSVVPSVALAQSQIVITTQSLPDAEVRTPYMLQLEQQGGFQPLWQVTQGQLPPGLTLSQSGEISGTPLAQGQFPFQVEASEPPLTAGRKSLLLNVNMSSGVFLATTTLPEAEVGAPYVASLMADGGTPPYDFTVLSGDPSWLQVSNDGRMSGTPTQPGTHQLNIAISDSVGNPGGGMITLTVVAGMQPLTITPPSESALSAEIATPYELTLEATGGTPPYMWSVTAESPPPGLTLMPDGKLEGTPTQEGSYSFTVAVNDTSDSRSMVLTIVVTPRAPLRIEVETTHQIQVGDAATITLTTNRDNSEFEEWMVSEGMLNAGLRLVQASGAEPAMIQGTATATSTETLTLKVTDISAQETATAELTITAVTRSSTTTPGGGGGGGGNGGGRSRGGGGGSSRRASSGCACVAPTSVIPPSAWGVLAVLALLRRRRAR